MICLHWLLSLIAAIDCCHWLLPLIAATGVPERPPPPIVGKVTHHNIELYWDEALEAACESNMSGDERVRVAVQEEDKQGQWGKVYV